MRRDVLVGWRGKGMKRKRKWLFKGMKIKQKKRKEGGREESG
jgi:hypothetical protein